MSDFPSRFDRRSFFGMTVAVLAAAITGCDPNACRECSGAGKKKIDCPTCGGRGVIGGSACANCTGSGKTSIACSSCNGSGKKPSAKTP